MKCSFNDFIKQNDIICMPLYRRVFPPFYEKTWNPLAKEPVKAKQERFDRDVADSDTKADEAAGDMTD
jgi:hypothetical protein